ncbi:DUF4347 domain-containing protein [Candidatus Entotheonella palauensis]|uniref:DUF4347 domain-containing protein n=1 Tax=Candidatus Entotheonella palauensis TaxID=93172 RepID=UPI000B7CE373|nr:DUF4347 domain-containing protein [Candidatus Entotheonella palauensis]
MQLNRWIYTKAALWLVCLLIGSLSGLVGCHISVNARIKIDRAGEHLEIVILDAAVPHQAALMAGMSPQPSAVLILDAERDGIEQITEFLSVFDHIDALHIVSHAAAGKLRLGNTWLSRDNLDTYTGDLAQWRSVLSNHADLLFYGCNLASHADGRWLLDAVAARCHCDVAGSDNPTGHARLGGDWALEVSTGPIETPVAFGPAVQAHWPSALDITSNLVAHYALDEGSGTVAVDSSGNHHDGTHQNSPSYTMGRVGSHALDVNGNNDHILVADDPALNFGTGDFSVAVWFNSTQIPSGLARIIGKSGGGFGWVIFTDNFGDVNFFVSGTTGSRTLSLSGMLDGAWHHVVGVRSGANLSFYIDGLPFFNSSGSPFGNVNDPDPFLIGVSSVSGDFDGLIDDVRLYNRALSASDVNELFNDPGNTEQILQTNAGLTLFAGQAAQITQSLLETTDAEQSAAQLTYTLTTTPLHGTLSRNGTALGMNDTWTQDDINANRIVYNQNGKAEVSDSFSFTVDDGIGSSTPGTFNITIVTTPQAPTDLQATATGGGGLSLNTDGGNNAYLLANDGGSLIGGLTAVTIEASFTIVSPGTIITPLLSYAAGANHEELGLFITNAGVIQFTAHANGSPLQATSSAYLQLLDGEPHHLAVSWEASTGGVVFYVDGHEVESTAGYQTGQTLQ